MIGELDLVDILAERLFYAEMGHTGMAWEDLSIEFGQAEYRRKISRVCEGLYRSEHPVVVLDLDEGVIEWRRDRS